MFNEVTSKIVAKTCPPPDTITETRENKRFSLSQDLVTRFHSYSYGIKIYLQAQLCIDKNVSFYGDRTAYF